MSKQAERRKLAKLKAEFNAAPWAIDARALTQLGCAIETGDLEDVKAVLSLGKSDDETPFRIENGIAIIPINGVLRDEVDFMVRWGMASSYQLIEKSFNQAMDSDQVKGVLFAMNSPGGSAIGCKRVADLVFEARGEKPIRAYVQGMAGSACFYIAAACDRIEATADSLVASVGSIFPQMEYSGYLKEAGITATVFTNTDSPKKGHGNMYEPLTDAAKETLQKFVNSYGRPFIEDVARYRGIDPEDVIANYGQGDAIRADVAVTQGVIDAIVGGFSESLESMSLGSTIGITSQVAKPTAFFSRSVTMNERIKAQLFALGLIDSLDAPEDVCKLAMNAFFAGRGKDVPADEAAALKALQSQVKAEADEPDEEEDEETTEEGTEAKSQAGSKGGKRSIAAAHQAEQAEARLEQLSAQAEILNEGLGYEAITPKMVLESARLKHGPKDAMEAWHKKLAANESPLPTPKLKGEGADQYAKDVVDALVFRASNDRDMQISDSAAKLTNRPLWAVAAECLKMAGENVDFYGNRESIAERAMQMGNATARHEFFSEKEDRRYLSMGGVPHARPGDFPNILSNLANKYLDTIQLDDDYSYSQVSAVLPGGLNDFKPAMMMNKGIVEELDELQDAEQFKDLGLQEEVLSYIFLRRFGNRWGWTPVLVANDDMNAFAEGMLGLDEAWQVTQNRLVLDRFTANETLLDGSALFANRADVGSATNHNIVTGGAAPSDAQWGLMETQYADIGGINTQRRVRGSLNVCFCPTGAVAQEARRTFLPLNSMGLEGKVANTTSNVGLYRGEVQVVPESELRSSSSIVWYGLRNPTRLNTATVVRAYFNGYGTAGRRERWYDPTNKTTYVSLEGRIATAVKNWRYAVRNAGTGA